MTKTEEEVIWASIRALLVQSRDKYPEGATERRFWEDVLAEHDAAHPSKRGAA